MTSALPALAASPPPSGKVSFRLEQIDKGSVLHRIHDSQFAPTSYNPGFGGSRFAPFSASGKSVPTAYAATSLACAVYETIFHDIDAGAPFRTVSISQIRSLNYSTFGLRRPLSLAALFSADLMKFSLERGQVIDTPRSGYPVTRLWSPAAHESDENVDGMIWVSRRYDQEQAMILFGDRILDADTAALSSQSILEDSRTLEAVFELGQRSGITIVE